MAGAYIYIVNLTSLGFGTTALPGLAIANPENNGYLNYIISHLLAIVVAFLMCFILKRFFKDKE